MLCHVQAKDKREIVKKKKLEKKNQCSGIENRALYERPISVSKTMCPKKCIFKQPLLWSAPILNNALKYI